MWAEAWLESVWGNDQNRDDRLCCPFSSFAKGIVTFGDFVDRSVERRHCRKGLITSPECRMSL